MARTSAEIQADLDRVSIEIASSSREVHFGDRGKTNRTTDEAIKARAALERELQTATAAESARPRVRQVRMFGGSGF